MISKPDPSGKPGELQCRHRSSFQGPQAPLATCPENRGNSIRGLTVRLLV